MDEPVDEEFSLEAMQRLIDEAQETIRSVRLSLRLRDPSIDLPEFPNEETADNSEAREEEPDSTDSNRSNDVSAENFHIEPDPEPRLPASNESAANCEVREAHCDTGRQEEARESNSSRNSEQDPTPPEPFELPEAAEAAGCNSFADDEVILVSETRNPNPVVIDLCSPDVCGSFAASEAPQTGRRRRRRLEEVGLEIVDQRPPPEKIAPVENDPFRCTICMENMKSRRPHSTICGHMFCQHCIASAIRFSKRCPICRKGLTPKSIHPIYF
ncbi:E3 ubiquitin-protein ligase RNF4-like isoform X1 [Phlebotomus papatasi]|uniref:E3 ubiquitin-protein ligase RNF4-like isoform X1 n=1 Tax=Phlebotomus papatasi TaxID=29031 RepID=UPI00248453A9|nr:E3 ubiquitin-protein ligase RNF4-like isoform X1 [Phlebotomus papatasi]